MSTARSKGTQNPERGTPYPWDVVAVKFGISDSLVIHGKDGRIPKPKLPRVKGGKSFADDFTMLLPLLLEQGDVVVESPTVGSSGVEPEAVEEIVASASHGLWVMSARAVKNYRIDHELGYGGRGVKFSGKSADDAPLTITVENQPTVHVEDAEIMYRIAMEHPERLKRWAMSDGGEPRRVYTSVRPFDKRLYRGEIPDMYMERFPPFESLPAGLKELLGNAVGTSKEDYSRPRAMPLAMALDEPGADTRDGYERILGLYDHGYPSFYRRLTVALMQANAKRLAGVSQMREVSRETRKEAWRLTRRQVRQVYHLIRAGQ